MDVRTVEHRDFIYYYYFFYKQTPQFFNVKLQHNVIL